MAFCLLLNPTILVTFDVFPFLLPSDGPEVLQLQQQLTKSLQSALVASATAKGQSAPVVAHCMIYECD
jgi:hypothetical protein